MALGTEGKRPIHGPKLILHSLQFLLESDLQNSNSEEVVPSGDK